LSGLAGQAGEQTRELFSLTYPRELEDVAVEY